MPHLKGFLITVLWMAVPVAAGAALLTLERQGTGPVVIERLLDRVRGTDAMEISGPVAVAATTGAPSADDRSGSVSDAPAPVMRRLAPPSVPPATCETETDGGIAVGDTVAVRFFEAVEGMGPDTAVTFERRDLSASVQVDRDGTISLPALGRVAVFAMRPACLEQDLARQAADGLGFSGRVSVAFASRPATLVRGAVLRPGSYAYDPAMTPARLVTLAGYIDEAGGIGMAERRSLEAQAAELQTTRLGLVLRIAHLRSALEGTETLVLPSEMQDEIIATLGEGAIATETELLRTNLRALQDRQNIVAYRADLSAERVDRLGATLTATEAELAYVRDRRDRMSDLLDSGKTTVNRADDAERSLLSLERERLERFSAMEDARMATEVARQDARMAETAWRREHLEMARNAELDLRGIETRIAGLKSRIDSAGTEAHRSLRFTLERATPSGTIQRDIGGDAILMPGDLVTVFKVDPDPVEPTQ